MSKKDYVAISRMIRTQRHKMKQSKNINLIKDGYQQGYDLGITRMENLFDEFINNLCEFMQDDNPKFDKAKFLRACELPKEQHEPV